MSVTHESPQRAPVMPYPHMSEAMATRLSSVQWRADEEFSAYDLSDDERAELRGWAQAWADINRRLYNETFVDDEDEEFP